MDEIAETMDKAVKNHPEQADRLMAFYEFHDSILESLEWNGTSLTCVLNAVCTVSNQDEPLAWGRQRIELRLQNATMNGEEAKPTIWLLEGELECDSQEANPIDQVGIRDIPASLLRAQGIQMRLFGENEDTHEFPSFEIRGDSMLLRKLDRVKWDETHFRPDLEPMSRIAIAQEVFEPASSREDHHF